MKPSNNFQQDRPESGGADRNGERENSGLLDRAKQEFAEAQSERLGPGGVGEPSEKPHKAKKPDADAGVSPKKTKPSKGR